jgi:DNA-directed RNA polymerase subunit alpha
MDLTVQRGKGYSPSEERGKLPVDEIPIDAIFSPIKKANFRVEPARVGQVTNYDNLLLEVWTDGSISPREAITEAAKMLVRHFSLVAGFAGEVEAEIAPESEIPSRVYDTPIEELELSVRAYNCLKRANITKVGEVLERLRKSKEEILNIRNFGQKSLDELMERLQAKGYLDTIQPAADLLTAAEEGGESETPSEGE